MEPTATIYDPDTKSFVEIPESELAPGMIRAQVEGHEGVVWIELGKLKQADYQHAPFIGDRRDKVATIQAVFPEVYDKSYEFWEDGFRRDANPDKEIGIWLHIAEVYSTFAPNRPVEYRSELFQLVLACSNSGRDQIKIVFQPALISSNEVEEVVSTFYGH
jgi:hypothetical protein